MNTVLSLLLASAGFMTQVSEARLDRAVQLTTAGGYWGSVLVARGGTVLLDKGYGFADYGSSPNRPDTLFELASASKQITATAILLLEQNGALRLDETLGELLPDVPEDKRSVTVHQLLTHTAGLSPRVGLPYASPADREEFLAVILAEPLDARPGARYAYSNAGYAVLAALVEVLTGQTFEQHVEAQLFAPAGLSDSGFIGDDDLDRSRAAARLSGGTPDATAVDWHRGWGYRGMGGVVTTTRDLLAWDRALRDGTLLDAQHIETLYRPVEAGYACGWRVQRTPRGTTRVFHSGRVAGFGCLITRYLEEDVVIVLLSNGKSDLRAVWGALDEQLFPPPRVEVFLDWGTRQLGEHSELIVELPTSWVVTSDDEAATLSLTDPGDGSVEAYEAARVILPRALASKLTDDLERLVERQARASDVRPSEAPPQLEIGIYLMRQNLALRPLQLDERIDIEVRPYYRGRSPDGEPVVDDRITLILRDRARGMWPLIVKMNPPAAAALLSGLRDATR